MLLDSTNFVVINVIISTWTIHAVIQWQHVGPLLGVYFNAGHFFTHQYGHISLLSFDSKTQQPPTPPSNKPPTAICFFSLHFLSWIFFFQAYV